MDNQNNFLLEDISDVRRGIIDDCMIALGYPVVSLFVTQEQISKLIDYSVRKCSSKATPKFLETFYSGNGVIDVSDYHMEAVSAVYSGDVASSNNPGECDGSCNSLSGCNICDKLCQYRGYSSGLLRGDWNNELYNQLAYLGTRAEFRSLEIQDVYLDNTSGKLYLDGYIGTVTVEYIKSTVTLEDLTNNSYWISWVRDYTLAMVKITEGRIRGKYKMSSGVFEVEADELVSEGNTDKQELEERLNENIGYWNILR